VTDVNPAVLSISGLTVTFKGGTKAVRALDGVDLSLRAGEVVALLGESGSGKSVTLRSILRLHSPKTCRTEGRIVADGIDVMALEGRRLEAFRGKTVSMIFQEPMLAMDPVYTVGQQIIEAIRQHEPISASDARERALDLLRRVRIPSPENRLNNFPHEMSGGMRQRAMIALALSSQPKILLADEPTTALDATVQVQILLLLRELQQEFGLSMIFVTHDIAVAVEVADRIAVMYAGRIIEMGSVRDVIRTPRHPYTIGLLSTRGHAPQTMQGHAPQGDGRASSQSGRLSGRRLPAIPGSPPDLAHLPPGCAFAPRCVLANDQCRTIAPTSDDVSSGHTVRCHRAADTVDRTRALPPVTT
jgi:peptide/nickel transport system ATP-binding protein